jgi:hypothetical protein
MIQDLLSERVPMASAEGFDGLGKTQLVVGESGLGLTCILQFEQMVIVSRHRRFFSSSIKLIRNRFSGGEGTWMMSKNLGRPIG